MATSTRGMTAKLYLRKHTADPTRTLARKMCKENPGLFDDQEQARRMLRYYRGQNGKKDKESLADLSCVVDGGDDRRSIHHVGVTPSRCRILVLDIETSPMLALPWGCLKQYINPEQLLAPQRLLCWAACWLGETKVHYQGMNIPAGQLPDDPIEALVAIAGFYQHSDYEPCESVWKMVDEADIVVAHNGKAFDTATLNTRWLDHGMPEPSPYRIIDTLWTARRKFRFPRNKLESIARYRKIGKKVEHEGFELWKKCMCGDPRAIGRMKRYNIGDVRLLAEIYMDMRPWVIGHPNVALSYEDGVRRCMVCGSSALKMLANNAATAASVFDAYRCETCGKVQRSRARHKPVGATKDRMANVR